MSKNTPSLLLVLLVVLASCGGSSSQPTGSCDLGLSPKIISGQECVEEDSPIIKIVTLDEEDNEQICSGTLISPDTVLTALHCFDENTFGVFAEVRGVRIPFKNLTPHPKPVKLSRGLLINDLALIQFESVLGEKFVTRFASEPVKGGQRIEIYGYGRTDGNDFRSSGELRRGEMEITSLDENFLLADYQGVDQNTCLGDSGGPAFIQTKDGPALVGVIAAGVRDDCGPGDTSIFVNLQSLEAVDFLQANGVISAAK